MPKGIFDRLQHTLAERAPSPGLTLADLMALPAAERRLVNWMTRSGDVTWQEVVDQVTDGEEAQRLVAALQAKGFLQTVAGPEGPRYRVFLAPRRKRNVPTGLWQVLNDRLRKPAGEA